MKIYYYSGATIPSKAAKSVHVMKMCEAWGRAGHDVTLFSKGSPKNAHEYYGTEKNFKIICAPNIKIPLLSGLIRVLHAYFKTKSAGHPDLIYGRDPISLLLNPFKDVTTIYEGHQMPYLPSHKWAISKLAQRATSNKMVVISKLLKSDMQEFYATLKDGNIFVAHDGATPPTEKPAPAKLKGDGEFAVGYTGSLQEGKGAQTILAIAEQSPDCAFHIIGGTEEQVKGLHKNAPPNVHFYGHVPHSEIPSYLQSMDILIAPYKQKATIKTGQDIARWISPLKIFEYMAAEKSIICSELEVIKEVLKDERNALLVEAENIEAWANAIKTLQASPELSQKLAKNAHEDLVNQYTWDIRAQNILEFIQRTSV